MELNKKNVAINITIVPVDPNTYYSTDEDSDSDSETEQQTEQLPTKEAPTSSCETRSERGTSGAPSTVEVAATKPSSSKEDAALEPVELIDGLFDFVPFNADEDVLLKDVESKDFNLESYLSDKDNSTRGNGPSYTSSSSESSASTSPSSGTSAPSTSSSQGICEPSTSSSPGTTQSVQKIQPSTSKDTTTVGNIRYGMGLTSSSSCSTGTTVPSTSSSSRFSALSRSSLPGSCASYTSLLSGTTASVEKMQSSSSKETTRMDTVRFGMGRGKDIGNLLKCYNRKLSPDDQQLLRKSTEQDSNAQFEKDLKASVKEVKKAELKPAIVRPAKQKETNIIHLKEKDPNLVKQKDVDAATKSHTRKSQSPRGEQKRKSQSPKENKEPIDEKAGKRKQKSQSPREHKDPVGDQTGKRKEKPRSPASDYKEPMTEKVEKHAQKSQSPKDNKEATGERNGKRKEKSQSRGCKQEMGDGKENLRDSAIIDEFTKTILASMQVVQRKPNLEKRKNSEPRRTTLFDEHSAKFQQYLSDKKAKFERTSSQPLLTHNSRNPTLKCGPLPIAIVKNKLLRSEPQHKQDICPENCASINNANVKELMLQQQTDNVRQICSPNGNDVGLIKQQNNIESNTSAPTSVRKISVQEYLNRKRPHQSTDSGLDSETDSKNANKKRISLAEYTQRRVMT